ncbi:MAG TPA: DUF1385 domain-containing protein [Anaerolineaceae bacterium]|nr:DUF1385 domain-containing protein [Anaerolineaceae bacterium]
MKKERLPSYGGQALIEGVLMRGSRALAAAMRAPDGSIMVQTEELTGIYQSRIKTIPFLRGLIILWDAIGLGSKYLTASANLQTGESEKIEGPALYLTLGLSLVAAIAIFVLLPSTLGNWVQGALNLGFWMANLFEAVFRLVLAIGYIWLIGKLPDIERVFAYHGAEHKTINAYEAGAELTPESVSHFSLEHPRCGTGFLLTVILFSIILFTPLRVLPLLFRLPSQVLLVPVIACLAYEYMHWTASHLDSKFIRALISPNLALQKLTTRTPTIEMLEVSIASFNSMLALETSLVLPVTTALTQPVSSMDPSESSSRST